MNSEEKKFQEFMEKRNPVVKDPWGREYRQSHLERKKRFKLGIWLYQKFGITTDFIRKTQDEFLDLNHDRFFIEYTKQLKEYRKNQKTVSIIRDDFFPTFAQYVNMQVGSWQAAVGLCRPMNFSRDFFFIKMKLRIRMLLEKYNI